MDIERQEGGARRASLKYVPTNTMKERVLEFLDYYFGPIKLYLFSYPMPNGFWDNRKWRMKASGVQVLPRVETEPIVDRLIHIVQKRPAR